MRASFQDFVCVVYTLEWIVEYVEIAVLVVCRGGWYAVWNEFGHGEDSVVMFWSRSVGGGGIRGEMCSNVLVGVLTLVEM